MFDSKTPETGRSRLDDLLEAVKVPYSDYILYCEATKVSALASLQILGVIEEAGDQGCFSDSVHRQHRDSAHRQVGRSGNGREENGL